MQTNPNYIEAKDVLGATNGGLDIILDLYPAAMGCDTDRKKKFKIRNEGTASANLKKADDGNWLVTDFGDDSVPRNGILCYAKEKNVDFVTALRELAAKYNVIGQEQQKLIMRADYSERPAEPEEIEGTWLWEIREQGFTDFEIETIISKKVLEHVGWKDHAEGKNTGKHAREVIEKEFSSYRWHPLTSYSLVKNRKVMTFSATDRYPIFLIDEKSHQKLYQPLHPDKSKRFLYIGTKPKDFIHGLDQLKKMYEMRLKEEAEKDNDEAEQNDREGILDGDDDDLDNSEDKKLAKRAQLKEAIICSGGSDALNVALMGYWVLWMNSETAKLPGEKYAEIAKYAKKIYQLPDIDHTGKLAAHELAMMYLDMYTIELPEELKRYRDGRGNPCKDVRDYFMHYDKKAFLKRLDTALPYRFWNKRPFYEGRGENRTFQGWSYSFLNIEANNFLMKNGFGRLRVGDMETEWIYIKRTGNIVEEVDADIIQDYIHDFLEDRCMDTSLRNAIITSGKLNATTLSRIKIVDIEFEDYTRDSQLYFFKNKTVEITREGIKYYKPGEIARYIWKRELIDHNIEPVTQPPFTITKNEFGGYEIEIHNKECMFLKYLVQVSRTHWRDELENGEAIGKLSPVEQDEYRLKHKFDIAGPNLSPEQQEEQILHLINKIFSIGFLLHRYHDHTKGWFVWAMDGKLSEDGNSHGGSGKSIMMDQAIRKMLPMTFFMNGRNKEAMEDKFKYDGITPYHRYYLIDDAFKYFKVGDIFVDITGDLHAPQKGKKPIVIPFEKSGKFGVSSNFAPHDPGPSIERRIIHAVFSDYYHNHGENDDYLEHRDPAKDLGATMFTGWVGEHKVQWNHFYQTMLHCLQFFLSTDEKIGPAMENVNKRTYLDQMGQKGFIDWANVYFAENSGHLDKYICREYAFEDYKFRQKDNTITANQFGKKVYAFCRYNGYILNPKAYLRPKSKAITQKTKLMYLDKKEGTWHFVDPPQKDTKELFFIQTRDQLPEDPHIGWPESETEVKPAEGPKLDI